MKRNPLSALLSLPKTIVSRPRNIVIFLGIVAVAGFAGWKLMGKNSAKPQYQTEDATKGTLVVSLTASGTVSTANNAAVTTQASGVVKKVYVTNGQTVAVGAPIAELELDLDGKQRSSQAYASYQNASNAVDSARANLISAQGDMFTNWKKYNDMATNTTYTNPDGSPNGDNRQLAEYITQNDQWLASEAKYKNQMNAISQAQTSLSSAWSSYQQASPVIYAPISGVVTGLSLQTGSVLTAQSGSSGNATAQKIASIKTDAPPVITVNLTEIDVPKVKVGNRATITFDAFPDKTFTGQIISLDTIGGVTSGVTTYPAIIKLDVPEDNILTNMSATANIITATKADVVMVPTAAVQTANGQSTVRIMKNGKVTSVPVETGLTNDTQTEIVSGVAEGDVVVTGVTGTSTAATSRAATSVFGGFGGGAGRGGGANVRVIGR